MLRTGIERVQEESGEVAAWVLVLVMSAALVISVWGLVQERLLNIVTTALTNVCGSVGC
jgi:TRAP-type mannitol/chloroaromatic compound transport system permease small subunit